MNRNFLNIYFFCLQHIIRASTSGTVEEIMCAVGDTVAKDRLLVKIKEAKE